MQEVLVALVYPIAAEAIREAPSHGALSIAPSRDAELGTADVRLPHATSHGRAVADLGAHALVQGNALHDVEDGEITGPLVSGMLR